MFQHATKLTFESKECPGVTVTLKKLTVARRAELDLAMADQRAEYFRLLAKANGIEGDDAAAREARAPSNVKMISIDNAHFKPAMLKACIHSIEGLEIDGVQATVETLLSDGPTELCDEIYKVISAGFKMTGDEEKNSQLPSTSGQPEAQGNGPSTATTASA